MAKFTAQNQYEKEFFTIIESLCYSRDSWRVWSDFIFASAITLSNTFEPFPERKAEREKEYKDCIERLGGVEKPAKLLKIVVMALEEKPEQDFLGELFIKLRLNDHWRGQFFTPYHICEFMAQITLSDSEREIKDKGYVSVCDCACGAGAMLVAAANVLRERGINFQKHALFVAQDIDRTAGLTCFIQLSLLGCPGYVVIGNSLTNPVAGEPLAPMEMPGQELWCTPMFYTPEWNYRRFCMMMQSDKDYRQDR